MVVCNVCGKVVDSIIKSRYKKAENYICNDCKKHKNYNLTLDTTTTLDGDDLEKIASWQTVNINCSFCGSPMGLCQHPNQLHPYMICFVCKERYEKGNK